MALTKIDGEFTSPDFADQDIVTTGDVGIGTTAPIANLDIAPASSSASLRVHARSDSSAVPAIELMRGTNTTFGADLYQDFRLKNSAGELIVEYGQSGSISEALRVDSLGNVGIGTTSPSVLLHMAANEPQFYIQDANSTGNNVNATIQFRDSSNTQLSYLGYAGSSDSHFSLFNTMSGGDLRFGTASTERMRIDSSGRVGIGTTSPGTPLHIANQYPSIRLQSNTGSYQQRSTVGQFDNIMYIECDNDNAVASSAMAFTVDASEKMRIDSSGRVLIGTATEGNADADALTISSTGGYTGITLRSDTNQGGAIYFSDATSGAGEYDGYITYAQSNQSMSFGTAGNGSPRMLIDSSGFIHQKFTSNNSSTPEGLLINNLNNATGNNASLIFSNDSGERKKVAIAAVDVGSYGASDLVFALDSADSGSVSLSTDEKMRINSSGQVLIGTASPSTSSVTTRISAYSNSNDWMLMDIGATGSGDTGGIYGVRSRLTTYNPIALASAYESSSQVTCYYGGGWGGYGRSANELRFYTSAAIDNAAGTTGNERMRIDSSGRVGIGTSDFAATSPYADNLVVKDATDAGITIQGASSSSEHSSLYLGDTTANRGWLEQTLGGGASSTLTIGTAGITRFYNNGGERMRIDSNGDVHIGKTAFTSHNTDGHTFNNSGWAHHCTTNLAALYLNRNNSNGNIAEFYVSNSYIGNINYDGTTCTYNSVSDYRLKENIVDIADGISRVKQLSPRRFNFISNPDTTVDGFIAHEAQSVVPEAVCGEKDGEQMQGIDQSKLVPLLTAALQEAIAKIETLETKVAALEAQ